MSQQEVLTILEREFPGMLSTKEIMRRLPEQISPGALSKNLTGLKKARMIAQREISRRKDSCRRDIAWQYLPAGTVTITCASCGHPYEKIPGIARQKNTCCPSCGSIIGIREELRV